MFRPVNSVTYSLWAWLGRTVLTVLSTSSLLAGAMDDSLSEALFTSPELQVFQVDLSPEQFEQLDRKPRSYVQGTVRVGGKVYEKVGIRLKGTGTYQPITQRPSLALKFNWKVRDQEFSGLTKIFLNNSGQDATRLCEYLASAVFREAGVPAPRITQAQVQLNGRDLGLYVLAEPVNKRFLKRNFHDAKGVLYEGEFQDIDANLEQDNGPASDGADLKRLAAAARLSDPAQRQAALGKILDLEQFLNFLAAEMIVANWDGYAYHQNNYRIYNNPETGKMVLIPHGLDNTLFESGLSFVPPHGSVLVSALVNTPEARADFRDRVARLLPKVLNLDTTRARLRAGTARLKQDANPDEAEAIECKASLFEQRIRERIAHLQNELKGVRPKTPEFNGEGVALLQGWAAKPDWNHSPLTELSSDGRSLFHIQATNGFCFGSWRLPVWLPPGKYRFEGVAKTTGVLGLPSRTGSGAGVRVLGNSRGSGMQRSQDWTTVKHGFVVHEGGEWLELVAELRAFSGTAYFDADTLRLVRMRQ